MMTVLAKAAREVRDNPGNASCFAAMCALISRGERLADDELEEYQPYVDAVHERWSVPKHKRDEDFQLQSMSGTHPFTH